MPTQGNKGTILKIIRFEDKDGNIGYGAALDQTLTMARRLSDSPFAGGVATGEPLAVQRLLTPLEPVNILAIGLNYRRHAEESNMALPERPVLFIKPTSAVIGPDQAIVLPKDSDEVDYEAELAVIIGKTAKDISEADALDYVLGYTCANDVSARDWQLRLDRQWARGKSFDTFCPIGPAIVTTDEIPNPGALAIQMRVSGETLQSSQTSDLIFSVQEIIAYLSRGMTLLPGTVIITGTPEGVGMGRTPQRWLKPGDVCEVELEGIGVLRNPVVAG
jgi:2-keto-4-pentenoate hydratase/2-oxohepta-3-ene-1,7-dioic acid hydratase in catechol pathway